MGNLAVIDITGLPALAREGVFGGASALDRVLDWADGIPGWGGTILLASPMDTLPGKREGLSSIVRENWNEEILVSALEEASGFKLAAGKDAVKGAEAVFFIRGDSPLIDPEVTSTLWDLHYRYDAEYTFADGYPAGLAPEILGSGLAERLVPLARGRKGAVQRDSLFEILRQDINAFDVETHLSPEDLRMLRVSITCDTRRNREIAERLYSAGGRNAESLCRLIPEAGSRLRSYPAYFPIQVTDHCPQACSYCSYAKDRDPREGRTHIDVRKFTDLCHRIVDFAGDAVFNLSPWGEPASHPEIGKLMRAALESGRSGPGAPVSRLIIETSGIGWNPALLEELAAEYPDGTLMWIVSLDAADPELYRKLRGDGMDEAAATAGKLVSLFGDSCWIQAVRMKDNEENLEDFYRLWKEKGARVIVQKYDSSAGELPERQPADLSPLNRIPCWHLKRDMVVGLDGSVPACRAMAGRADALGNAFEEDLKTIWARGENLYLDHVSGEYPGICGKCDEYYTFNF